MGVFRSIFRSIFLERAAQITSRLYTVQKKSSSCREALRLPRCGLLERGGWHERGGRRSDRSDQKSGDRRCLHDADLTR